MSAAYGDPKYGTNATPTGSAAAITAPRSDLNHIASPTLRRRSTLLRELGLRWHAGGADRRLRHSGLPAPQPGDRRPPAEDRLQGRYAALGLGQRGDAATEEGPAGTGRLESVPHQRERRAAVQPADQPLHHYHLRRQELSRMAVRPIGGGHADCATSASPTRQSGWHCCRTCIVVFGRWCPICHSVSSCSRFCGAATSPACCGPTCWHFGTSVRRSGSKVHDFQRGIQSRSMAQWAERAVRALRSKAEYEHRLPNA